MTTASLPAEHGGADVAAEQQLEELALELFPYARAGSEVAVPNALRIVNQT